MCPSEGREGGGSSGYSLGRCEVEGVPLGVWGCLWRYFGRRAFGGVRGVVDADKKTHQRC